MSALESVVLAKLSNYKTLALVKNFIASVGGHWIVMNGIGPATCGIVSRYSS